LAKDLQINDGTLDNWVKLYLTENPEPEPELKPSDRVRLAELEAEARELRMENPNLGIIRICRIVSVDAA